MMDTYEVGKKLVDLCKAGKNADAINTLYSQKVVSIEPHGGPQMPQRMEGLAAIREKNEWWVKNHKVYGHEVEGPWPAGDRFIVRFQYDVEHTGGPMKGQRMKLDETGLYTVKDGKIVQEEFFYHMPK
jgi:hypothetical protein